MKAALRKLALGLLCILLIGNFALAASYQSNDPSGISQSKQQASDIFLLFDTSSSMSGDTLLRLKETFCVKFLPTLQPGITLHIYTFDRGIQDKLIHTIDEKKDTSKVYSFINDLQANGRSTWAWHSLEKVLDDAKKQFLRSSANIQIFMYTDGKDTQKKTELSDVLNKYSQLLQLSDKGAGLKIYTLGFSLGADDIKELQEAGVIVKNVPGDDELPVPSAVDFEWGPLRPQAGGPVRFINLSSPEPNRTHSKWDFGDGSTSRAKDPEHTYLASGSYEVVLTIGSDVKKKSINVVPANENLKAKFRYFPEKITAGQPIQFFSQSTGAIRDYEWQVDQNPVRKGKDNFVFQFSEPGEYIASLTIFGEYENDSTSTTLHVADPLPPNVIVNYLPEQAQVNQDIIIWASIDGNYNHLTWEFPGANIDTSKKTRETISYSDSGEKEVVLKIHWRNTIISHSIQLPINPEAPPECKMLIRGDQPYLTGQRIFFQDDSLGHIANWSWDFGDGTSSTEQHPEKIFKSQGPYEISLIVSGPGGSDAKSMSISIVNPPPPIADFLIRTPQESWIVGEPIIFQDQSTGQIESWKWDFGDGAKSLELQHPEKVFEAPGIYQITMQAIGPGGFHKKEKEITISNYPAPHVDFSIRTPYNRQIVGEVIAFQNNSIGRAESWLWDFGDGEQSKEKDPTHTYSAKGPYNITLNAKGPGGEDSFTHELTIRQGFIVDYKVQPLKGQLPLLGKPFIVKTKNLSTGENISFSWDFGDGSPKSPEFEPEHKYSSTGSFLITLEGTDQITQEKIVARELAVEIIPNHMLQDALIAEGIILLLAALAWIVWLLKYKPPPIRKEYNLAKPPLLKKQAIVIGAGWKGDQGRRHEIPLPFTQGLKADFADLERTAGNPSVFIEQLSEGQFVIKAFDSDSKLDIKKPSLKVCNRLGDYYDLNSDYSSDDEPSSAESSIINPMSSKTSAEGMNAQSEPETTIEEEANDFTMELYAGETVEVDDKPYVLLSDLRSDSVSLYPGFTIMPGRTGQGNLKLKHGGENNEKENDLEEISLYHKEPISLIAGDKIVCGPYVFEFEAISTKQISLKLISDHPSQFPRGKLFISLICLSLPWIWLLAMAL